MNLKAEECLPWGLQVSAGEVSASALSCTTSESEGHCIKAFVFTGMMVVKLAKYDDIKAAVILHPGRLTDDDVNGMFS